MEDLSSYALTRQNRARFEHGVAYIEIPSRPARRHGLLFVIRQVKKESPNKDRKFFCCPNDKENSCKYLDWMPEESYYDSNFLQPCILKQINRKERETLLDKRIHKRFRK